MNRPNELIKEIQDFNEDMYGYELSKTECKELTDYISMLEKALDIAIDVIYSQDTIEFVSTEMFSKIIYPYTIENLKESILKESEKQ